MIAKQRGEGAHLSSYVLTLRFQRHSEKDPKRESSCAGDENQNGVGHWDGCK